MFDAAKSLLAAGIRNENPGISPAGLRVQIFNRFYESDFDPGTKAIVIVAPR